ncbi:MAG: hypothetical protein Terrestrivirus1_349 [Terrestrivirus sp.]|uniref:Uncharacterized protein n=1 Tax=Terrestrivirus sp. TaxID=2487775 RepID=A0A3G4ZKX0_9VIRU|nr:MAG: hypothetical protein Terrestrivirus1_349 [Terrestrivirus sp.]
MTKCLRTVKVELFECLRNKEDLEEFAEYAWEKLKNVNRKNVLYFVNSSPGFHLRDIFYENFGYSYSRTLDENWKYVEKVGCGCCNHCKHVTFVTKYNTPSRYRSH